MVSNFRFIGVPFGAGRKACPSCLAKSVARVSPDFTGRKPNDAVEGPDGHYEVVLKVCDGYHPSERVVEHYHEYIQESENLFSTGEIDERELERRYKFSIAKIKPIEPHTWEDRRFIRSESYKARRAAEWEKRMAEYEEEE